MNVRQSIVVRRDLQMTPGLLAAQVAHISANFVLSNLNNDHNKREWSVEEKWWFNGPVMSVLAVNTPEELDVLIEEAKRVGVKYHVWKDTIPSQIFTGKFLSVVVGVSFGPDDNELIKQVTGTLPLF